MREKLQSWADDLTQKQHVLAAHHPRVQLTEAVHRAETSAHRLQQGLQHRLDRLADRLQSRAELLKHIGPQAVLARGFSFATNAEGKVLKDASEVKPGDEILTRLAQGTLRSVVKG